MESSKTALAYSMAAKKSPASRTTKQDQTSGFNSNVSAAKAKIVVAKKPASVGSKAANTARWRNKKRLEDEALVAAYNKKRAELNLPPVSLMFSHEYAFRGQSRPTYNPPPEKKALMSESDLAKWRAQERKRRKAQKQRENRRDKQILMRNVRKEMYEMGCITLKELRKMEDIQMRIDIEAETETSKVPAHDGTPKLIQKGNKTHDLAQDSILPPSQSSNPNPRCNSLLFQKSQVSTVKPSEQKGEVKKKMSLEDRQKLRKYEELKIYSTTDEIDRNKKLRDVLSNVRGIVGSGRLSIARNVAQAVKHKTTHPKVEENTVASNGVSRKTRIGHGKMIPETLFDNFFEAAKDFVEASEKFNLAALAVRDAQHLLALKSSPEKSKPLFSKDVVVAQNLLEFKHCPRVLGNSDSPVDLTESCSK